MELTKNQMAILVSARRAYLLAARKEEEIRKEKDARFAKLKEACQGSGSPEQVLAKCDQLLAQEYIHLIESGGVEEPIGI